MYVLRHLRWALLAGLAYCLVSCRPEGDPKADTYWSESDVVQRWGAEPAAPLPIYLNEDGSVKEGYGITDTRELSDQTCLVHGGRMHEELQDHKYMFYDDRVRGFSRFFEAREEHFPNAQQSIRSPLTLDWSTMTTS